jgi:hypothetical protein
MVSALQLKGVVEIDGTYLGGQSSNRQNRGALRHTKHGLLVVQQRREVPAKGSTQEEREGAGGKDGRRMFIVSCGANENKKDARRAARTTSEKGSTIVSDMGSAFKTLGKVVEGKHETVNHSKHFKDPETGTHSNTAEGRNRQLKEWLSRQGRNFNNNEETLWRNLAQYVWQQWFTDGSSSMKFGMFLLALFDAHGHMPRA